MPFGIVAVIANCVLWYLGSRKSLDGMPDYVFTVVFFAALLLPVVPAWRGSKWWLALSFSPIVQWVFVIMNTG